MGLFPTPEPQKTQIFMRIPEMKLSEEVIVLVLAHHLVGENPGGDNRKNKKCNHYKKWPPRS